MVRLAVLRDGLELPYVEQGDLDGVPVVLLHAWLDSRRYFDQLMAMLPERIRAFAFDQRGHGDAAKPADGYGLRDFADDIGAFMDVVGLDAAVLVGASSGSPSTIRAGRSVWRCSGPRAACAARGRGSPTCSPRSRTRSMQPLFVSSTRGWSDVRFPRR